jgi:CHAT domain-containing protein
MGLRASLEASGAGTVLMSLWKVPDESTAVLMQHFYRGLWEEGLSPAAALRRAQEAVRSEPRYSAPLHWAAWVLSGNVW